MKFLSEKRKVHYVWKWPIFKGIFLYRKRNFLLNGGFSFSVTENSFKNLSFSDLVNFFFLWKESFFEWIFEWEKCSFSLYFWRAESEIRPFEQFGLLSFYENPAFIFLIFGLIFRSFKFFGLMISAFCDFGLLSFGLTYRAPQNKLKRIKILKLDVNFEKLVLWF